MANSKFEFTGETKVFLGVTPKRIRALISFGAVAKGEVGGWIAEEKNVDPSGNAWVSDNADFFLSGPLGSRRACLSIHADAKIGVRFTTGCFSGTEFEFKKVIQETHGDNEFARQYRAAIDLATMVVKPHIAEAAEVSPADLGG